MGLFSRLFDPGKGARRAGEAAAKEAALRGFTSSSELGSARFDPSTGAVSTSLSPQLQAIQQQLFGQAQGGFGGFGLPQLQQLGMQGIQGLAGGGGLPQFQAINPFTSGPFSPNRDSARALNQAAIGMLPQLQQGLGQVEDQRLQLLREQARPFEQQAMAGLNQQLFGTGQGAITGNQVQLGGGRLAEAFGRGLGQADVGRQLQAGQFALAQRQSDLGTFGQLFGAGQQAQSLDEQLRQGLFGRQLGMGQFGLAQQGQGFGQALQAAGLQNQAIGQGFGIGQALFGAPSQLQQQQLQALAAGTGLQAFPQQLFGLGLGAEQARSQSLLGGSQALINAGAATPNPLLDILVGASSQIGAFAKAGAGGAGG